MNNKVFFISMVAVGFVLLSLSITAKGEIKSPDDSIRKLENKVKISRSPMLSILVSGSPSLRATSSKEMGEDFKNQKETIREEMENKMEQLKNTREEFKQKIKDEQENLKKEIEAKKEKLKNQLNKIKDERKKQTVEKINEQLDKLNQKMIHHFLEITDKLEKTLGKIGDRSKKDGDKGLDVSAVNTAITDATNAITAARTAIETQSSKVYTIKITTETNLKTDVGAARQSLHVDLVKVRDTVFAARDTVHNAATTLAKLHGITISVSPSPSPSASPSPSVSPTISATP